MNPTLVPVGERHPRFDANRLAHRIWQGAFPGYRGLRTAGFSVLVLCAEEIQPSAAKFEAGLIVVHAPNCDDGSPLTKAQLQTAERAASLAAEHWRKGGRIYVSCAQGRNRSGLVSALMLRNLTPLSVDNIVQHIRSARPRALQNQDFVTALVGMRNHTRLVRQPYALQEFQS